MESFHILCWAQSGQCFTSPKFVVNKQETLRRRMMNKPEIRHHGSWKSPITSDLIISGTIGLGEICLDGDNVYWIEGRPAEAGRCVIVRRTPDGQITDATPAPFNARTRVHEYGGGAYVVSGGAIYFSNFADGRIYYEAPQKADAPQNAANGIYSTPVPLTAAGELRYADLIVDHHRKRLICVCEDHSAQGREPANSVVSIPMGGGAPVVIASRRDFYSSPRLSPDGNRLAWLEWDHPNLPWDGTELMLAGVADDGSLGPARRVAGSHDESIFQPEWSPGGMLYFVSDRTGWWNLYRFKDGVVDAVTQESAEFASPQWVFGMSTYDFDSEDLIICTYERDGVWGLARIDLEQHRSKIRLAPIDTEFTEIRQVRAKHGEVVFVGGSPSTPISVVRLGLASGRVDVLRQSSSIEIDSEHLSMPRTIEFPTEGGLTAHAFFYPPKNRDFVAPLGEKPPLIVISHGGPTSAASSVLSLSIQYWTSRGFAVVDVNYGGSSGYGRAYRQRLNGQWGVVDVNDCVNAASYLASVGEADPDRLIIRGGSAGGYTTLAALTFRNVFRAGASYYGISDLEALEADGHKFESRYNHTLVGPYPEHKELYIERSPIHYTDRLSCPIILFQGLEDKVVPPNQAEMMVDALRAKGLPVAYVPFEGEGHGFRKAENIKRALDGELYFYSKVFGFELADAVEAVHIDNLG
jgi:dipeptidyl aminopeptidase/acylaminoacyl peptidase